MRNVNINHAFKFIQKRCPKDAIGLVCVPSKMKVNPDYWSTEKGSVSDFIISMFSWDFAMRHGFTNYGRWYDEYGKSRDQEREDYPF